MASKYQYDIVQVPDNATLAQILTGLNNKGINGWRLVTVINNNQGRFVVLEKIIAE